MLHARKARSTRLNKWGVSHLLLSLYETVRIDGRIVAIIQDVCGPIVRCGLRSAS
jgi:hypothetical protein